MATRKAKSKNTAEAADPVLALIGLLPGSGWLKLTLGDVAGAAGLPLAQLYRQYPSKLALLQEFAARIDGAMLGALEAPDPAASAKDRLFEVIMARFDALGPYREAMRVLGRELPRDPPAALCFAARSLNRALDWSLAAAGLDVAGLRGVFRRKVLGAVYLDTLRVWLADDSADGGATMAHLDRRLRQAMPLLNGDGFLSQMRNSRAA